MALWDPFHKGADPLALTAPTRPDFVPPQNLLSLAWPVALEQVLNMSLFWVDTFIINHKLGTEAFAAVQVSAQIFNMIGLVLFVVASGTTIVMSHQVGAEERREAGETASQSIGVGLLASMGLGAILLLAAPGDTRGPMMATLLVNVLNVALNYVLVRQRSRWALSTFRPWGAPSASPGRPGVHLWPGAWAFCSCCTCCCGEARCP